MANHRTGLRKLDMLAICGVLVIGVILSSAALGKAKEKDSRASCAANVTGNIKSMVVYAQDGDEFPAAMSGPSATKYAIVFNDKTVKEQDSLIVQKECAGDPLASFWMLVAQNDIGPKNMICRSDPFADFSKPAATTKKDGSFYLSIQNKWEVSYSIAYPWMTASKEGGHIGPWWKDGVFSGQPIMSDMAPFNEPKAKPVIDPTMKNAVEIDVTFDQPETQPGAAPASQPAAGGVQAKGHTYNSPNHLFVGQNIGFADSHVEWRESPKLDDGHNIWLTPTKDGEQAISAGDIGPVVLSGEPPYKVVMVPARASDGSLK